MPKIFTNKLLPLAFFLTLITQLGATAGDTLVIARNYYHVDRKNHLILINQKPEVINRAYADVKSHLSLDGVYEFTQSVPQVESNTSYEVKHENNLYQLYFTQLPVVHISSKNKIVDSPSVYARFALDEADGKTTDSFLKIEIRGNFSQTFPKKSYELGFVNDTLAGASRDVGLLGLRTDNKYNLQAMYNEPLRIRSKTSNELWQQVHQIYYKNLEPEAKNGIDMEYVEVFLNEEYQGIYALSERVDRKQLKLKKYSNAITGELYKGESWDGAVTFTLLPPYDNASETWGGFEYKHPEEKVDWKNLYDFVNFVKNSPKQEFNSTYRQKFHLGNAVDYFIFLNLSRAGDNTGKNIYIAKYKQGEPYYYVPWDLDGVFGTDWMGIDQPTTNDVLSNGFYDRLLQDCSSTGFRDALRTRWAELRTTVLTEPNIMAKFRANHDYLLANNAFEREKRAWPGFEQTPEQFTYINTWLKARLAFLDTEFSRSCLTLAAKPTRQSQALQLYPNPAANVLNIDTDAAASYELSIRDLSGREVLRSALHGKQHKLSVAHLQKGVYVVTLQNAAEVRTQKLVLN
ncbi:T9SS C-terminal target domain-containing protein [Hymenobacter oligotrophus]|uniref:T9SS C-terminal target domain-containing protein n=1 Tax=Hymenobacter oligotrophus TaxID=2319843 RepID=A0A3B7RU67_9BACT|nr:CotH kinase family protein [Hymenobacter oligotrophus]AYA37847.1 T9SS C-terminal target domain-containing protein [Hymenobacter oligotrophus]